MIKKDMTIRKAHPSDHASVIAALQNWWGGRDLTAMLPKLILNHFNDTSFLIEKQGQMIGFMSPALENEAYVHFMGIHPDFRNKGLGKILYERFFELCRQQNRTIVRACTSPVNKGSVAWKKGFSPLEIISKRADQLFVETFRKRFGTPRLAYAKKQTTGNSTV